MQIEIMTIEQFVIIGIGLTFVINGITCAKRPEDAVLSVPQLLQKYGYPPEIHHVTTTDGYILELQRIPTPSRRHPPIFLQHGLGSSSDCWVIMGPKKALAYILSDRGFDVWLGNGRGNTYSRNHTTLNLGDPLDSNRFWNFSLHEMGVYDLPACIDYVLEQTKQTQMYYVGHSQGCAEMFVLLSGKPWYNNKIKAFFALAPAVYLANFKSPLFGVELLTSRLGDLFQYQTLEELIGSFDLTTRSHGVVDAATSPCIDRNTAQTLCGIIFHMIIGNSDQLDPSLIPIILGHFPAGTATKQLSHFNQMARSGSFSKYDYKNRNMLMYNQSYPPKYNLQLATVPTYVYYGRSDWLIVPKDVERLIREIPNVQEAVLLGDPNFSHVDFIYGSQAKKLLYNLVIQVLNTLDAKSTKN